MVFNQVLAAEAMKIEVDRAMDVLYDIESKIPRRYIQNCHGIVLVTVTEFGMVISRSKGSGLLIGHSNGNKWSPPIAISYSGIGLFGLIAGQGKQKK